jgi:hypothetical protein
MDWRIPSPGWVNIEGLQKADVLAALYNASVARGNGLLDFDPRPMTREEAAELLRVAGLRPYFDYLHGRVMKIDLSGSKELDARLYDRDNGPGAAARAIEGLWEQLTRPATENACCPLCAGRGVVSKQEAEQWADARRAAVWRMEGHVPCAETEVDEDRFRHMELVESAELPPDADVKMPSIELSQQVPKRSETGVDVDRFRVMREKPPQVWQVLVDGEPAWLEEKAVYGRTKFAVSATPLEFPSRKEALAAANRLRRYERRVVEVERKDVIERRRAEAAEKELAQLRESAARSRRTWDDIVLDPSGRQSKERTDND